MMQLSEAIDALLIATRADGRSKATVDDYRRKLKPFVRFLGDVPVAQITTLDLRRYITDMMDRSTRYTDHPIIKERAGGLSMFTVAGHVRAFKRLLNWLEAEDIIDANPARRIKTPQPKQRKPKAIEQNDFLRLLASTDGGTQADKRDRAILFFLADSGCRVGGLCGLRVGDVDLDAGLASVTEKGEKTRMVPFTVMTAEALRDWLDVRPGDRGPWVFVGLNTNSKGSLSSTGVFQMLQRRAKRAGVTGRFNPHSFRHYFAREFLLNGGDLAMLCELMGHSSVEVTKSFYANFTVKERQAKHALYSPIAKMLGGVKYD